MDFSHSTNPLAIGIEHVLWARRAGFTPAEVVASVGWFPDRKVTWEEAAAIVQRVWNEMIAPAARRRI